MNSSSTRAGILRPRVNRRIGCFRSSPAYVGMARVSVHLRRLGLTEPGRRKAIAIAGPSDSSEGSEVSLPALSYIGVRRPVQQKVGDGAS
jgi:hypothetical protein